MDAMNGTVPTTVTVLPRGTVLLPASEVGNTDPNIHENIGSRKSLILRRRVHR